MFYISKSKYCLALQCQKINWLTKYKPEYRETDQATEERMITGNKVGDLAMGLFGDFVEVTRYKEEGKIDISAMIEATRVELARGTENICEASFSFGGAYCAVDILRKEGDGYAIYEVKSSSSVKEVYLADISYQKYVLEGCGIKVTGLYLVHINPDYVFDGEYRIDELFTIVNVWDEAIALSHLVVPTLTVAEEIMSSEEEPDIDLSMGCHKPYPCPFFGYCTRGLPSPSVFDLYSLNFDKKLDYYYAGKSDFASLATSPKIKNDKQRRQIDFALNDRGVYVDKPQLTAFLDNIHYPLYFLDFETIMPALPMYVGTKPNQHITFQYSLHYIESEGGKLRHLEFLGEPEVDPRRALAEALTESIPEGACVTVYNKKFECSRLEEMAKEFPDLAPRLREIASNIVDLLDPFQKGYYYKREIGGSFSIKSVLPAICKNVPELDYHALDEVHNGTEAMTTFPAMAHMTKEERARTRKNLLAYCKLDTLAMVKVWEELVRVSK